MDEGFSPLRVFAMVKRYYYLLISSWPRVADLIYWPLVQVLTWGFLQTYLVRPMPGAAANSAAAGVAGTLIAAMILWDILFRTQLGFALSFLEELWSRNVANLMMSPLRPFELIASLMLMSLIRLAIGMVPVIFLTIWFFGFNLFSLGPGLAVLCLNLILTSWAIGIFVAGLLLRNGLGAEGLVWTILFVLLPLVSVYYPVAALPAWLRPLAWALPPTYVFEAMRELMTGKVFDAALMLKAFALNGVYFSASVIAFRWMFESARRHGSLLQMGE